MQPEVTFRHIQFNSHFKAPQIRQLIRPTQGAETLSGPSAGLKTGFRPDFILQPIKLVAMMEKPLSLTAHRHLSRCSDKVLISPHVAAWESAVFIRGPGSKVRLRGTLSTERSGDPERS